ncbi:hypothetical protein EXIGLDRAFT_830304 [Exidia glandulosa HHB12029]|uniref:SnoaL-like domain-containing protein n=1 Tax=Exidia glandulosa HHB12029 TaxID=1314781 RepID=A0A165NRU6_EXIGL|nr:hypothetical protein EXIGLDRAFT_830304 [Exidia glandulosa HHB12029]
MSLEQQYKSYLAAANAHDWATLATFYHPTISLNDETIPNTKLLGRLGELATATPQIQWTPDLIVCDEAKGIVAAKLQFEGTNAAWTHVGEMVFYQWTDGKISKIWNQFKPASKQS